MAVLVKDDFKTERGNLAAGNAETGQAWAVLQGGFGIDGWSAIAYSNTSPSMAAIESGASNCSVSFTVNGVDTTGVIIRQKQGTTINAIRVEFLLTSIRVVALPAGTVIATQTITNADTTTAMKVVAEGSSIKVYKNNVLALTTTSSYNLTETRHGFYTSWDWCNFGAFLIESIEATVTKNGEARILGSVLPVYPLASVSAANQLRTYHPTKGISTYELVPITDAKASKIRVYSKGTIKAIKKE